MLDLRAIPALGAESRNRTGLAALEAQSFALNKPRMVGRRALRLHGETDNEARASTRSRRTESNRARSRTERLLHLGATTARLVESPGTAPGEPACKAGARPSAQPRGRSARNRTSARGFGVRSATMASDLRRRVRGSNSSHSIDNRAATPVASRGIHRVPGENRTRARWLRRPASDHRQRLG